MTGTNCDLFYTQSVLVIFEPPCIYIHYCYYYYYYYYYYLTAFELSACSSSPTLVQTKIKITKRQNNYKTTKQLQNNKGKYTNRTQKILVYTYYKTTYVHTSTKHMKLKATTV
jgi:hypothetical protein